jgi:CheY-like chemotaxis protein
LLVEDNPGDVRLTRDAFSAGAARPHFTVAKDGVEALAMLRHEGKYSECPRPDLILLDINLPLKDGREVLKEIKSDDDLRLIPVVMLTTSDSDSDVKASYRAGANCYVTKPVDLGAFNAVVRSVESFWLSIATLPPRPRVRG